MIRASRVLLGGVAVAVAASGVASLSSSDDSASADGPAHPKPKRDWYALVGDGTAGKFSYACVGDRYEVRYLVPPGTSSAHIKLSPSSKDRQVDPGESISFTAERATKSRFSIEQAVEERWRQVRVDVVWPDLGSPCRVLRYSLDASVEGLSG